MSDQNTNPNPAPSSAPAAAPAPTPAAKTELSEEDVASLLKYDPFSGDQPPSDAPPGDPGTPSAAPESVPPAPAAPPQVSPEVEALQKQLAAQNAALAELREKLNAPPAAPATPAPEDEVPPYVFDIPPQLMQALDSEDPMTRAKGYSALLTGTARSVHKTIMDTVTNNLRELVQELPQVVQRQVLGALQQKEIYDDFYGTYKELNVNELRPTVVMTARQVMQELGVKEWSPQVKTEVARRVYGLLGKPLPGTAPPAPPNGGGYNPNGGVRGPVNPEGNLSPQQKDILNTLF